MPYYSVSIDGSAYYARVMEVPRTDAITTREAAYAHACATGGTVDPTLDKEGEWDAYEDKISDHYGRDYDEEHRDTATSFFVKVVARVSICCNVHVKAKDEDASYEIAHATPPWPKTEGEWVLQQIMETESCDATLEDKPGKHIEIQR